MVERYLFRQSNELSYKLFDRNKRKYDLCWFLIENRIFFFVLKLISLDLINQIFTDSFFKAFESNWI